MSATVRAARAYQARATLPGVPRRRRSSDALAGQNLLAERWYRLGTLRYVLYRYGRNGR
jgi:hypothetical protein